MYQQSNQHCSKILSQEVDAASHESASIKKMFFIVFNFHLIRFLLQGYYSQIHEIDQIEIQPDAWLSTVLPTTTSVWLVLIPIVVVLALIGVVIVLVQRHRRLANSFSRFANSHYDTKTGATRIGDALEDDDHHETPRFEDDEPLVI